MTPAPACHKASPSPPFYSPVPMTVADRTIPRSRAAPDAPHAMALAALVAGACAMGISPAFVRSAEVGPFASAFWRVGAALPLLAVWFVLEVGRRDAGAVLARLLRDPVIWTAGGLFAADLFFWHLAIVKTTMANATFLATMAPVWVALGSGLFLHEPVDRRVLLGIVVCLVGGAVLLGGSFTFAPERLAGDLFGLVTSFFFGLYFLAVRSARRRFGPGTVTFASSAISAVPLLAVALILEPTLLPSGIAGVAAILALAVLSHVGGQGLLSFALGHLSAAFSSLVIFLEAIAAAVFGWLIFSEALGPEQIVGGLLICVGIVVARPRG